MENEITKNRKFLLYPDKKEYIDIVPKSDEEKKLPFPLFQKPYPSDAPLIDLPSPKNFKIGNLPFLDLVNSRVSRRRYSKESLSLEELQKIGQLFYERYHPLELKVLLKLIFLLIEWKVLLLGFIALLHLSISFYL